MCYLIAKNTKKQGCIALKTKRSKELADYITALQERLGDDIELITISRPVAYNEYEPYCFANSSEDFERKIKVGGSNE